MTAITGALGSAAGPDPDVQVFTARLTGRPLLDSDGRSLGRVRDVVIVGPVSDAPNRSFDNSKKRSR